MNKVFDVFEGVIDPLRNDLDREIIDLEKIFKPTEERNAQV
jgi:hypothetical protein